MSKTNKLSALLELMFWVKRQKEAEAHKCMPSSEVTRSVYNGWGGQEKTLLPRGSDI